MKHKITKVMFGQSTSSQSVPFVSIKISRHNFSFEMSPSSKWSPQSLTPTFNPSWGRTFSHLGNLALVTTNIGRCFSSFTTVLQPQIKQRLALGFIFLSSNKQIALPTTRLKGQKRNWPRCHQMTSPTDGAEWKKFPWDVSANKGGLVLGFPEEISQG